jgi:hypothetical protein
MMPTTGGTVEIKRAENASTVVVSNKIRWLAVIAGCASIVFGPLAFGSLFLVVGAVVQPRAPTSAKWLMWVGALLLSVFVIPLGISTAFEQAKLTHLDHHITMDPMFVLLALSATILCCCDAALLIEALKSRHNNPWVGGRLDWLVWMLAAVLSSWCVWLDLPKGDSYLRTSRPLDLIFAVGVNTVIFLFDVALIAHATKSRRSK